MVGDAKIWTKISMFFLETQHGFWKRPLSFQKFKLRIFKQVTMSKRFMRFVIFVNSLLAVVYVFSSFHFWQEMNNWYDYNMQSTWTPFYVHNHRIPGMSTVEMPVPPMLNLPFIIFVATIITNIVLLVAYFVVIPLMQKWASENV